MFSTTLRSVFALLLSYALLVVASSMFSTLLVLRSQAESFGVAVVGFMAASYSLGLMAGARFCPGLVAGVGHIRAFGAFASLISVSALIHLLWIDPLAWIILRSGAGFVMAGLFTVTESWLNGRASNQTRGGILAAYMVTNYAAAGCGQLLVPVASPQSYELFTVAAILFSLALVPVLMTRSPAPEPEVPERMPFATLLRLSPLGFYGAFTAGMITSSLWGLGPLFARGIGLDLSQTAIFMAVALFSGLILQFPIGFLSDRIGRRKMIGTIALLSAAIALLLVFVAGNQPTILIVVVTGCWGATSLTLYSLAAAHTNDQAPPGQSMRTATAILMIYGIGAVAGPIFASLLMKAFGPRQLFLFLSGVALILGVVAFWRLITQRDPIDRQRFKLAGGTEMTALQFDPPTPTPDAPEATDPAAN